MIENKDVEQKYNELKSIVFSFLNSIGFKINGGAAREFYDGIIRVIEFQRGRRSTNDKIVFTINIGVIVISLYDLERGSIQRVKAMDGHLYTRVASSCVLSDEKWWELYRFTDVVSLSNDVIRNLEEMCIPYLRRFNGPQSLIELWESGRSPGLTMVQRDRFLSELKGIAATK